MPQTPIFRFAIISDTHIRPFGESSSPWKTNLMTNDRARWVVQKITMHNPDFIIHLGDIVHPVPHLPTFSSANKVVNNILHKTQTTVYYVPGNHDIGDKDNPTVPSYKVNKSYIQDFKKYYGPTFQSFDHKDIHFILINSPVCNSGLEEERLQKKWLEKDLYDNLGRRMLVFSHYPPYLYKPEEPDNYDNIDFPERKWLLDLFKQYKVEAVFSGHVHHFGYKKYYWTTIYNLLSTCFVRQDFSEIFRVEPADEFGRNDEPKLGYCLVDIYKGDHRVNIFRSYGKTLGQNGELGKKKWIEPPRCTSTLISPIGVHIRHPLTEITDLPYMGPVDEFVRKRTRNDYPILGLWETGIKWLRLPLQDLGDENTKERLHELHEAEHRFMFFTVNMPDQNFINENRNIIDILEIILPRETINTKLTDTSRLQENTGIPVFIANIESSIHRERKGPKFSHYISHGFHINELEHIESILAKKGAIDGFVFQINQSDKPLNSIRKIYEYSKGRGFKVIANIRLSSENPAEYLTDDDKVTGRVAEAVVASYAYPEVMIFLDTFIDHDRGYFPRVGLYDRRINPRKSALLIRNLNIALHRFGPEISLIEKQFESKNIFFKAGDISYTLRSKGGDTAKNNRITLIDLITGEVNPQQTENWCLEVFEEKK